jgi:hypothetical protein
MWNDGLKKWDTDLAAAAGMSAPASVPDCRTNADTAADLAREAITAYFRKAERYAVLRQRYKAAKAGAEDVWPPDRLLAEPAAPCGLATVDVGLGKTTFTIDDVIKFVNGEFEGDGPFDKALWQRMVEYIVGDHRLASEITDRFNALQPGIALRWLGMGQDAQDGSGKMCRRFEDMTLWTKDGGRAADMCAVCPHKATGDDPCPYVTQWHGEPIIVVAAPAGLTIETTVTPLHRQLSVPGLKGTITHHADMIIQDETRLQSCVAGFDE